MKTLLTLLFVLSSTLSAFATKNFHFPDEEYAYAKLYYFNLGEITSKPDSYIYSEEDGWASSLVDPNITSSHGLAENMEKLFLYGTDGLINGLSGCFIPRHGLVYFDENDEPVASLSICFECEGIRMWTKSNGKIKAKSKGSIERAESQLKTLRGFVQKEGAIVSENPADYLGLLTNEGASITMELYQLDKAIIDASYRDVWEWNKHNSFKEDVNVEYAAGGDKYEFAELYMDDGTKLSFDGQGTGSKMVEAKILNSDVVLPNGIHVGSSLDDVMNTFDIYDGPAFPELIILKDHDNTIQYHFTNGKVDQIEIYCYFH